jgi:hypothetical protein
MDSLATGFRECAGERLYEVARTGRGIGWLA